LRVESPYAVAAGVAIAGWFVARAAIGVPAEWAYARGKEAQTAGHYADAARLLDRGAAGSNTTEALWLAGQSSLQAWAWLPEHERFGPSGDAMLRAAAVRFLAARAASPSSAWFTAALGDVYTLRERAARARRAVDLDGLARGPWGLVGDDGRIAIGLTRAAIDREPTRFEHRDELVFLFEENGLHAEALRAMEESARVLPDFSAHPEFIFESLPRDLVKTFWKAARSLPPGDVPLLSRERIPLASGQLGRRLGHLAEAEQDLRAALEAPGTSLARAEESFHLGLVLVDLGRLDEAETMFARASEEPVFAPGVAQMRAVIAEKQGRWAEALEQLREARRLRPRELGVLLEFARVAQAAGQWDQADESLRWTILIHPEAPEPRRALVEMLLNRGDTKQARSALDDYIGVFGRTADAERIEKAMSAPLDPAPR